MSDQMVIRSVLKDLRTVRRKRPSRNLPLRNPKKRERRTRA